MNGFHLIYQSHKSSQIWLQLNFPVFNFKTKKQKILGVELDAKQLFALEG